MVTCQWLREAHLKRQKVHLKQAISQLRSNEIKVRKELLAASQRCDVEELRSYVESNLRKYEPEIPPELYQHTLKKIDKCAKSVDFKKLYLLYEILNNSNKKSVFRKLEDFLRR